MFYRALDEVQEDINLVSDVFFLWSKKNRVDFMAIIAAVYSCLTGH